MELEYLEMIEIAEARDSIDVNASIIHDRSDSGDFLPYHLDDDENRHAIDIIYTMSREYNIALLNENTCNSNTFKKFLLLRISAKEFKYLVEGKSYILERYIPDWVFEELNSGREVESLIYIKERSCRQDCFYQYIDSTGVLRIENYKNSYINNRNFFEWLNSSSFSYIINGLNVAKVKISSIDMYSIDKDGNYDVGIEINKPTQKELYSLGKYRPVFCVNIRKMSIFKQAYKIDQRPFIKKIEAASNIRNEDGSVTFNNVTSVVKFNMEINNSTIRSIRDTENHQDNSVFSGKTIWL